MAETALEVRKFADRWKALRPNSDGKVRGVVRVRDGVTSALHGAALGQEVTAELAEDTLAKIGSWETELKARVCLAAGCNARTWRLPRDVRLNTLLRTGHGHSGAGGHPRLRTVRPAAADLPPAGAGACRANVGEGWSTGAHSALKAALVVVQVHGELEREKESWALFGGYRDALNKMANELWVTIRERCGRACKRGRAG